MSRGRHATPVKLANTERQELLALIFHQKPRSLVQAGVAQVQLSDFRLRPGCRFGNQGVRSKAESKCDPPPVYSLSISLK